MMQGCTTVIENDQIRSKNTLILWFSSPPRRAPRLYSWWSSIWQVCRKNLSIILFSIGFETFGVIIIISNIVFHPVILWRTWRSHACYWETIFNSWSRDGYFKLLSNANHILSIWIHGMSYLLFKGFNFVFQQRQKQFSIYLPNPKIFP